MAIIRSKITIQSVFVHLFVVFVLFALCALVSLFVIDEINNGAAFGETLYWLVILLVGLTVFIIYIFIGELQSIKISDCGIEVKKKF